MSWANPIVIRPTAAVLPRNPGSFVALRAGFPRRSVYWISRTRRSRNVTAAVTVGVEDEAGVLPTGFEQEPLINGSSQIVGFSQLEATLNNMGPQCIVDPGPRYNLPMLRSDPGMPSSHAQSIFFTATFFVVSMVQCFGLNGWTAALTWLIFAVASYFSWLRISQKLHTISQVLVGAALGFCFSSLWFWLWDGVFMKAFISSLLVRIIVVLGAAGFCVGFIIYVISWTGALTGLIFALCSKL